MHSVALLGDDSLAVAACVVEDFAGVEAERQQAEQHVSEEEEECDDGDPAHHAHLLADSGHALCATELALGYEGGGLLGLND